MTEVPQTTVPDGPADGKERDNLTDHIWRAGWETGHVQGWRGGFKEGKKALNQWWAVIAICVALGGGIGLGAFMDFFHTCVPITVGEEKSCTTRTGE